MSRKSKKVQSLNDGTVYASATDAANAIECSKASIYNSIRTGVPVKGTLWRWADEGADVTYEETLGICRPLYVTPDFASGLTSEGVEWMYGCSLDYTALKAVESVSRDNPQRISEVLLSFDTILKLTPEYDSFMWRWFMSAGARGIMSPAKDMDKLISRVREHGRGIHFIALMEDDLFIYADSDVPFSDLHCRVRLISKKAARKLADIQSGYEAGDSFSKRDSNAVERIWEKETAGFNLYEDEGRQYIKAGK